MPTRAKGDYQVGYGKPPREANILPNCRFRAERGPSDRL